MRHVPLYILAGGASRRFGRDKAVEPVDGRPLIEDVAGRLGAGFADTTLVLDRFDRYDVPDTRQIVDDPGGVGPIGGLHAALQDCLQRRGQTWLFLASCDLVRPELRWVAPLLAARGDDARIVAYRDRKWEPLFALYHTRVLAGVVGQIARERYSLQHLCDEVGAIEAGRPEGLHRIPQANTPEELRDLLRDQEPDRGSGGR